jgi:hypothetical protein
VSDGNGKPAEVEQGMGGPKYTLSITWDVAKDEFNVTGMTVPPWVSLGMLKYLEILVRRRDAENAMRAAVLSAPRIAHPGGRG